MKKLIIFISIVFILIIIFFLTINKERSYKLEYRFKDFNVVEKYEKSIKSYLFNIEYNDIVYDFIIQHNYSTRRNIVCDIKIVDDENKCIKISVFGLESSTLCNNGQFYIKKDKEKENGVIKEYQNVRLFSDGNFYVWTNHGISSLNDEKEYEIFKKEVYNNSLYYQFKNYLLFANYDDKRSFNYFYIFDSNKKSLNKFNLNYDISFDSYFMGDIDGFIYLYDRKNKVQYKINIDKKQIIIVSDKNGGQYYDNGWINVSYNKLNYNDLVFNYQNKINYYVKDNKLYLKYYDSDREILISDKNITDIIRVNGDKVYYIVDSSIYVYEYNKGESKIMENFEWNFSYTGKIFIFD